MSILSLKSKEEAAEVAAAIILKLGSGDWKVHVWEDEDHPDKWRCAAVAAGLRIEPLDIGYRGTIGLIGGSAEDGFWSELAMTPREAAIGVLVFAEDDVTRHQGIVAVCRRAAFPEEENAPPTQT